QYIGNVIFYTILHTVIYEIPFIGLNPDIPIRIFSDTIYISTRYRVILKIIAIVTVQPSTTDKPHKTIAILQNGINIIVGYSIFNIKRFKVKSFSRMVTNGNKSQS